MDWIIPAVSHVRLICRHWKITRRGLYEAFARSRKCHLRHLHTDGFPCEPVLQHILSPRSGNGYRHRCVYTARPDGPATDSHSLLALVFVPAIGTLSHFFLKRRALATGIVVSGSSIGGIVFPISELPVRFALSCHMAHLRTIVLNHLFKSVGFGWGVRASGFLILGCLVAGNLLIHTRLPPRKQRPAHMQFEPDMSESASPLCRAFTAHAYV